MTTLEKIIHEVSRGRIFNLLPDESKKLIRSMPPEALQEEVERIMSRPQAGYVYPNARFLMNPCLAAQWLFVFVDLSLPRQLRLFEPCVGSSDPVILAAEVYSSGAADYTSVNLNRKLATELKSGITGLRMKIHIIEDTALHASHHIPPKSLDVACFHHAINDILQTAVSEPRGLDTRDIDWWANERQMIEWLAEDARAGRLDQHARPALVEAVRQARSMVKPGGYLLFDHWTFENHSKQPWFPWDFFCTLIPMAWAWIQESEPDLVEVPLPGKDPQWWLCLQLPGSSS